MRDLFLLKLVLRVRGVRGNVLEFAFIAKWRLSFLSVGRGDLTFYIQKFFVEHERLLVGVATVIAHGKPADLAQIIVEPVVLEEMRG
jgi:hypothetical protein